MLENTPIAMCPKRFGTVAGAMLLVAGLLLLVGCQGVSAAGPSGQQQSSTLSLPSSLDFGTVAISNSKTLTVTVTNSGPASVTISSVAISTKYFSLVAPTLPITVAAGQSTTVSIKFAPNAAAAFNATLAITSDASNPLTNLSLLGTGTGTSAPGQLALDPASEDFGSVTVGAKQSQTVTLTNNGGSSVNISQASVSGTGFQLSGITTPLTLNASQSTTLTVAFAPRASGSASGTVTITSDASDPTLTFPLSGTGLALGALGSNPSTLSFGSVTLGSKRSLSATVNNTGSSSITISQVGISGTGFSLSGITTPVTLAAGQSATFTATFTPQSVASASGNVTVTSNASNPTLAVPLTGTGTATAGLLNVAPTTLNLGSVVVGSSGTASGSLTASGSTNVTVTAAISNNSVFSVGGLSLPVTIPAGQSAPFTVTFSPQVAGGVSAALTFTSNAQPAATTETLTGTGTAAPNHSVDLSWKASTSSNITGYNIYRAVFTTACGAYAKINSVLDTSTLYTDASVADGASYCYASTAVNTSKEESAYSNIVSNIKIPTF